MHNRGHGQLQDIVVQDEHTAGTIGWHLVVVLNSPVHDLAMVEHVIVCGVVKVDGGALEVVGRLEMEGLGHFP